MIIDWFQFIAATALLWLPRQWLRLGRRVADVRRRRQFKDTNPAKSRSPDDQSISFRAEFTKLRNYIDLLRAAVGAAMLFGMFPGLDAAWRAALDAPPEVQREVITGQLLVTLVGVLIQMFRFEHRIVLFPPVFFLTGLTFGMCGLYPAGFAFVLVWAINLALPSPASFLSVHALLILTFGLLFGGLESRLPFAVSIFVFLPVLLSLLSGRRLAQFNKRMKSSDDGAAT